MVKSDGSIWFTDPIFGILGYYEGYKATPEVGQHVYRLDGETGRPASWLTTSSAPTGSALRQTNLSCTWSSPGVPHRKILAYDVTANGRELRNKRVVIDAGPGPPDGMRCDIDGNLWCGWGMGTEELDGVVVFAPDGTPIGRIALPERCANVCFGGLKRNRLFMAASQSLYALYVNTQGVQGG